METDAGAPKRRKYAGYNTVLVMWHETIAADFDPLAALKELAESRGLIATEKSSRASRQLRIDTGQSSQSRRKRRTVIDKSIRQDAAKLLRRALKDPESAERIKRMVERARQGEDVGSGIPDALEPSEDAPISYRRI
jgi:hypothetical protein